MFSKKKIVISQEKILNSGLGIYENCLKKKFACVTSKNLNMYKKTTSQYS